MPKKLRDPVTAEEKQALFEYLGGMIRDALPEAAGTFPSNADAIEMFMRGGLLRRLDGRTFDLPENIGKEEKRDRLLATVLQDGGCHLYQADSFGSGSFKRFETDFTPGRAASFTEEPVSSYEDETRAPKKPGFWSTLLKRTIRYRTASMKLWEEYQANKEQSRNFAYYAQKEGKLNTPPTRQEAVQLVRQTVEQEEVRSEKRLMEPVYRMVKDVRDLQMMTALKIENNARSLTRFRAASPDKQNEICNWMAEIFVRNGLIKDMFDHRAQLTQEMEVSYTRKLFNLQIVYDASDLASTPAFKEFVENMTEEQYASLTNNKRSGIFTHGDKAFEGFMAVMAKHAKAEKAGPEESRSTVLSFGDAEPEEISLF